MRRPTAKEGTRMVNQAARRSVPEAVDRLLSAWHGEVEARAVYEAVAAREDDPERAAILRRMADAEAGHRTRIEARLQSLGVAIPDPATVRLSAQGAREGRSRRS